VDLAEIVTTGQRVLDPARIALPRLDRQAAGQAVRDRATDGAFRIEGLVVAIAAGDVAFDHIGRRGRANRDRAGGRVAAIEARLRPLQHLDLAQVEELLADRADIGTVDAIEIDSGGRITGDSEVVHADAPDRDSRLTAAGTDLADFEVRRRLDELADPVDLLFLEALGGNGGDIDAHVHCRLCTPLGRDDDVAAVGGAGRRRVRQYDWRCRRSGSARGGSSVARRLCCIGACHQTDSERDHCDARGRTRLRLAFVRDRHVIPPCSVTRAVELPLHVAARGPGSERVVGRIEAKAVHPEKH